MRALLAMGLATGLVAGVMAQSPAELKVGDMAPDFTLQGTGDNNGALQVSHSLNNL